MRSASARAGNIFLPICILLGLLERTRACVRRCDDGRHAARIRRRLTSRPTANGKASQTHDTSHCTLFSTDSYGVPQRTTAKGKHRSGVCGVQLFCNTNLPQTFHNIDEHSSAVRNAPEGIYANSVISRRLEQPPYWQEEFRCWCIGISPNQQLSCDCPSCRHDRWAAAGSLSLFVRA
eukprot:scaffold187591_cov27-Tisochrysis_lutea.AAC.1